MLGAFQNSVVLVAVVILVIALIIIAIMLIVQSNESKWPPYSSTCPDYWDVLNNNCENVQSNYIGLDDASGCNKFSLDSSTFTGDNGDCNKLTYATHCNLTWDGITNSPNLHKTC